jgi:hypothetical protein
VSLCRPLASPCCAWVASAPKTWIIFFFNLAVGISRSILRFLQPLSVPILQDSVFRVELRCQEHIKYYGKTVSYNRIIYKRSYFLVLLLRSAILLKAVSSFQCVHCCRSTGNTVAFSTTFMCFHHTNKTALHSFPRTHSFQFSILILILILKSQTSNLRRVHTLWLWKHVTDASNSTLW